MLWIIIALIISYLIGSIPTAYIFGRFLKGIDIRKHGSGNVGATNALRVLGKRVGVTVLILDILKGLLPVILIGDLVLDYTSAIPAGLLRIYIGIACIIGHNWTLFLNFKGGKGIATTLGVLIGLALRIIGLSKIIGLVMVVWFAVFFLSRFVSLASIIAGISLPIFMIIFNQPMYLIVSSLLLSSFVVIRHKSNISRLLRGNESRLSFRKTPPSVSK